MKLFTLNTTALPNKLITNFACGWSADRDFFVLTDEFIYILQISPNLKNPNNNFNFTKSKIKLSTYFIADHIDNPIDSIINKLSKENFYETVLNPIVTPHTEYINPATSIPIIALWSDHGIYNTYKCMLVAVSNLGNAEIFVKLESQWEDKWIPITNITEHWVAKLKTRWEEPGQKLTADETFNIITQRVQAAICTSVVWSLLIENEKNETFCYIFLGHGDGQVSIWKINYLSTFGINPTNEEDVNNIKIIPEFICSHKCSSSRITSLLFCTHLEQNCLVVGDLEGIIKLFPIFCPDSTTFEIKEPVVLWEHKDIRVSKIVVMRYDDRIALFCVKGSFILFYHIMEPWKVSSSKPINIGNLNVTGLTITGGSLWVSTQTGTMKVIRLLADKDTLNTRLIDVQCDIDKEANSIHGIMKSPGGILWGLLTYPCKLFDHLLMRNPVEIVFCYETPIYPEDYRERFENDVHTNWDYLETIRCLSIKLKQSPVTWIDILRPDVDFDTVSIAELQLMYYTLEILHTTSKNRCSIQQIRKIKNNLNAYISTLIFKSHIEFINMNLDERDSEELAEIDGVVFYTLYSTICKYWQHSTIKYLYKNECKEIEMIFDRLKDFMDVKPPHMEAALENLDLSYFDEDSTIMNIPNNLPNSEMSEENLAGKLAQSVEECLPITTASQENLTEEEMPLYAEDSTNSKTSQENFTEEEMPLDAGDSTNSKTCQENLKDEEMPLDAEEATNSKTPQENLKEEEMPLDAENSTNTKMSEENLTEETAPIDNEPSTTNTETRLPIRRNLTKEEILLGQRCLFTNLWLRPDDVGWICKMCQGLAHYLIKQSDCCPICDMPLRKYFKHCNNDEPVTEDQQNTEESNLIATQQVPEGSNLTATQQITESSNFIATTHITGSSNLTATQQITEGSNLTESQLISESSNFIATPQITEGSNLTATQQIMEGSNLTATRQITEGSNLTVIQQTTEGSNLIATKQIVEGSNLTATQQMQEK